MNAQRREAILQEYGEVNSLFRMLSDIRFKLSGFLPLASVAAAAFGKDGGDGIPIPLALLGLATTVGIMTYNKRNDQLYCVLVGRAAGIERSVGLPDGAFCNRPRSWLSFKIGTWRWQIDHSHGVAVIYAATIALWLYLTIDAALRLFALKLIAPAPPASAVQVATGSGSTTTERAGSDVKPVVGRGQDDRLDRGAGVDRNRRRGHGRGVVVDAAPAAGARVCAQEKCARGHRSARRVRQRPAEAGGASGLPQGMRRSARQDKATIAARAAFYGRSTEALGYYALTGSKLHMTASLVSLLTDQPPLWAFDLSVNRHGTQRLGDWTSSLPPPMRDATLRANTRRTADGA